ncbi:MAG: DUF5682 family protein [Myxococcota bacterium]
MSIHVFGIRHHGPGSARSLRRALEELRPDCVLVEGPPDANDVIKLITHPQMEPPVALLIHAADNPKRAVYYPFAVYSPEWQALHHAQTNNVPARFMDLPQALRMANRPNEDDDDYRGPRADPLKFLAEAAGYSDSERWWEHMVEERREGTEIFHAILEAMTALREAIPEPRRGFEREREAYMRQTIRAAEKEGAQRVAVVCGAWHAPALVSPGPAKDDAALLKPLAKTKVQVTWVPWTYGRLTFESGYGAGVEAPGWYHHLWTEERHVTVGWMTLVARLLREKDLDASAAHAVEAVRLADNLAALRSRPIPGLPEMMDAALAVLAHGNEVPLKLVRQKLLVGERLGRVPDDVPTVPLHQDLARLQRRLRLPPDPEPREIDLDLRKPNDLERSHMLHRLELLGITWGEELEVTGKSGTFHEYWRLEWEPELSLAIIEASRFGNTVEDAAAAYVRTHQVTQADLPRLTELLQKSLLASLPDAVHAVMERLESAAALASDVSLLMDALPPLVNVLRYGNVRQTDVTVVRHVVDGMMARITIGMPGACTSLDDESAEEMLERMLAVHNAVALLREETHLESWQALMQTLMEQRTLHGLIAGRACRILLDARRMTSEEAARRLGLALSTASEPPAAAAWLDGFLRNSGVLLLHDVELWNVVDGWLHGLQPQAFTTLLPLLRRTFSTFTPPERRQMGERAKHSGPGAPRLQVVEGVDPARAELVLPVITTLLGLEVRRGG